VTLLHPGDGDTPAQQQVLRYTVEHMLELRHFYVNPPPKFAAPEMLHWLSEERLAVIASRAPRKTGDVSKPRRIVKETAPALEDCKPLEVNDTTRWKSKVFQGMEHVAKDETDDDVLKQALLILNKLSLTTFDKLSDAFVDTGIGRSTECLTGAIKLILEKAQSEPHFANMYAMLCLKLSKTEFGGNKKTFKKLLLTQCQQEFEQDLASKLANISDSEEQAYLAVLIKKKYLGHMRFIGELYKGDMIKIDIMLWCLTTLLDDVSEEEKVECFCKLMSTIGFSLEQQSAALMQVGKAKPAGDLATCWKTVYDMSLSAQVSQRLKFMLLDLMEMRDKGTFLDLYTVRCIIVVLVMCG
jgi:translation initiation factor 4G